MSTLIGGIMERIGEVSLPIPQGDDMILLMLKKRGIEL
jgi:hypothetical protein